MFNSGFIPSVIDGTENEFVEPKNKGLLKEYSYTLVISSIAGSSHLSKQSSK
jgi:hypothetical protein